MSRCIGCCACMRACRAENDVARGPLPDLGGALPGPRRRRGAGRRRHGGRLRVRRAAAPRTIVKAFFVPKLCNHCEKSVCSQVCPVGASYHTPDGVVLVDQKRCIGCGYCVQACPYGMRFIDPHGTRPTSARLLPPHHQGPAAGLRAGLPEGGAHLRRPEGPEQPAVRSSCRQRRYRVLKPEMGTHPKCYYIDLDLEVI